MLKTIGMVIAAIVLLGSLPARADSSELRHEHWTTSNQKPTKHTKKNLVTASNTGQNQNPTKHMNDWVPAANKPMNGQPAPLFNWTWAARNE